MTFLTKYKKVFFIMHGVITGHNSRLPGGESDLLNLGESPDILKRFEDISKLTESERNYIFNLIDMCLRDFNTQRAYAR